MTNPDMTPATAAARLGIVVGSTRPGRKAAAVAEWVRQTSQRHPDVASGGVEVTLVDLAEVALPLLDEPVPAAFATYAHDHTRRWAATVASLDALVFVTPEYNHSFPAALKNAIDYLFAEWHHKPAGFVSYGLAGGVRAVEHLRLVLAEVKAVPISAQVALSVFDDFTYPDLDDPVSPATVAAREHQEAGLLGLLHELVAFHGALAPLRATAAPPDPQPVVP